MPSDRKQLNVRLPEESHRELEALRRRMEAALGIELSQADVIRAAIAELGRRYPDEADPPPAPRPRRKGRAG